MYGRREVTTIQSFIKWLHKKTKELDVLHGKPSREDFVLMLLFITCGIEETKLFFKIIFLIAPISQIRSKYRNTILYLSCIPLF